MSIYQDYIFVLWGNDFEEAAASIFVSELREAGLRVKVVGLTAQRINGCHGLGLIPDMTLEQALPLASQTRCLIIPNTATSLKRLENDPRLRNFCDQAQANEAMFVIGDLHQIESMDLGFFSGTFPELVTYPDGEELVTFAREMAERLVEI